MYIITYAYGILNLFSPFHPTLWKFKRLFCLQNITQDISMRSHQILPYLLIGKYVILVITIRLYWLLISPAY